MSGVFVPRWRTRPAPVDFGCPPGTNPESPNKPPMDPYSGFSGDIPEGKPNLQAPSPVVCYVCRGTDFWIGTGKTTCRRCHPPAPGAEVLTPSGIGPGTPRPVEIDAGSTAPTPEPRTHGVRGGAA